MLKGKALRRALETKDAIRVTGDVPLITDTTELITPAIAQEMLKKNKNNRPINWRKVEEYSDIMSRGEWKLHSQGIIFDETGNLLTGQKRLWAVIYSGVSVLMRVSRGCPADTVRIIDRGTPQTGKDLASRETKRKHSPSESSVCRAYLCLKGIKSNPDVLADAMIENSETLLCLMKETKGTKKTKAVLMMLAAILAAPSGTDKAKAARNIDSFAAVLDRNLHPCPAEKCWGHGAAFTMAMVAAQKCLNEWVEK